MPKGLYLNDFSIPELGIANPKGIIDIATSEVRLKSLEKNGGVSAAITKDNLEKANEIFSSYAADGLITLDYLGGVLYALGLKLSDFDVNEIINQLELKDTQDVSFTEAVEIAAYVSGSQEQF